MEEKQQNRSCSPVKGEFMILYYTGTGNSEYVAKRIANATGDQSLNLFERIRAHDTSPLESHKPWIVVTPTYAWRIPRILEKHLVETSLQGSREIYFVVTCGENIGNAQKYLQKLCASKNLNYRGCMEIIMPENYIALFKTPNHEEAKAIISRAEPVIDQAIEAIQKSEPFKTRPVSLVEKLESSIVNPVFYPLIVKDKKFTVSDECISCGKCVSVCPLNNVELEGGRPVWKGDCTHCMACISYCPKEAIEYGSHSMGLPRYHMSDFK